MHPLTDMSDFQYEILMEDEICLAVSPSHPFAGRKLVSLTELTEEPFIGFDRNNPLRQLIDAFLTEYGLSVRYVFETHDASLFRSMLSRNAGIGLVPKVSWQQTASDTVLIPLKEKKCRTLVIAWPTGQKLSPQSRMFCKFACEWFQESVISGI